MEEDNWFFFTESYFEAAKLLFLKSRESNKNYFLIPAFFSLRHGIECFLKFLSISLNGDKKKKHDIEYLFQRLEEELNKKDIKNTYKLVIGIKKQKNCPDYKDLIKATRSFFKNKEKIIKIIKKYQDCEYIKKYCNQEQSINDKNNEIFRFPDRKEIEKNKINYEKFTKNFKKKDYNDVLKDIYFLDAKLSWLGFIITSQKIINLNRKIINLK
jgi:hypothetical protein